MIYTNRIGSVYSDNIIDPLLTFETPSTWTVSSGTGTAGISTDHSFQGNSSLRIINNDVVNSITVTNSAQETVVEKKFDDFQLMMFLRKEHPLVKVTGNVKIFKNAVLLDTQTFTLGDTVADTDQDGGWFQFVSDRSYYLELNDVVTFTFTVYGITGSGLTTSYLYIDGIKLFATNRNQLSPTFYTPPIQTIPKQIFGSYNYQDDGTSTTTVATANSWYTVVNNADGPLTSAGGGFAGVTPYNPINNKFDLSALDLYDEVDIRMDLKATTTTGNDTILFRLNIASGTAYLNLYSKEYDVATTDDQVVIYVPVGVLTELAKTDGFTLECSSNASGTTVKVNGYYIKVNKRLV